VALIVAAAAAAFGALVLGEYELVGLTPYVSGVLYGLAVAEVALTIGRDGGRLPAALCGVLTAGGMAWGAWISSGQGVAPVPLGAWVGAALGGLVSFGWVRWSGTRGLGTRPPA
jgi:hypothetical protein